MIYRICLALSVMLCIATASDAAVYRWVDKDGVTHYSDIAEDPAAKAYNVHVTPPGQAPTAAPNNGTTSAVPGEFSTNVVNKFDGYKSVAIKLTNGSSDGTIDNTSGEIQLSITVDPKLQDTDAYRISIDGSYVGDTTTSADIKLGNADRGVHHIKAAIVRKDMRDKPIIESDPITVNVHRPSKLIPKPESP